MTAMTRVDIVGVFPDVEPDAAVVLLGEAPAPTRVLPIIIGRPEAAAIAMAATGVAPARPGTHDLMTDLLDLVDARVEEVAITELRNGTFYAELFVEAMSGLQAIDARPSDGLALAVRSGAQIVVAADVLDEAAVPVRRDDDRPFTDDEVDEIVAEFGSFLSTLSPDDFGDARERDAKPPDDRS